MVSDVMTQRVDFSCRHCGCTWSADYDIARYEEPDGETYEYYRSGGQLVPSPFVAASVLCPSCHQPATIGHPASATV